MERATRIALAITLAVLIGSTSLAVMILAGGWAIPAPEVGNIGLIRIEGTIASSPGVLGILGGADPEEILPLLKEAREDPSIKAVLIRVNSPGGQAAASQEIYREIMRIRRAGKPVVVSIGDIATSGGYYVASAADKIVAEPGALTGSIGVISTIPQLAEFLEKLGIKFVTIKAGKFKDIMSPYREITPEEKELLQEMIDDIHEQFIKDVAEGRGLDARKVREIADGRILTGKQAKELGLIDEFGNLNDAIEIASKLARIERPAVVELQKRPFLQELLRLFGYGFGRGLIESILSRLGVLSYSIAVSIAPHDLIQKDHVPVPSSICSGERQEL
ncbi:TPA: signal peptide peptidase SppA [Candidatus Bathyarchaeota archaeon]|nr:signal peptide peptidase SppA [Candidatus Bathyarchaeota archaeon]